MILEMAGYCVMEDRKACLFVSLCDDGWAGCLYASGSNDLELIAFHLYVCLQL